MRPGDCDDHDKFVNPGVLEACDDVVDNDCDGLVDADDPSAETDGLWFPDDDLDGLGRSPGLLSCGDPSDGFTTYVSVGGDCDDLSPAELGPTLWFADTDQDTYAGTQAIQYGCKPSGEWYLSATDCNDLQSNVHPDQGDACKGHSGDRAFQAPALQAHGHPPGDEPFQRFTLETATVDGQLPKPSLLPTIRNSQKAKKNCKTSPPTAVA